MSLTKSGILRKIEALAETSAGPAPGFSYPHVCYALLLIGNNKALGRIQLSKRLGLGEGTVRTILKHLSNDGIIKSTKQGCTLTPKGRSLHTHLKERISTTFVVDAKPLALDIVSVAVRIKGMASKVRQGIEQRDAAVRAGGTGACTLLMRRGRFVMPIGKDEWKLDHSDPASEELENIFHAEENDVIVIASAKDKTLANYAALAAGLTLLD